jgi:hypothetical protein
MATNPATRHDSARRFIFANARLIDRAIYGHVHADLPAAHVRHTLLAYRNQDGGFGHALEPDLRTPVSQPLHTVTALELLREAGIRDAEIANGCCAFLSTVADSKCAVAPLLAGATDYPAAGHWHEPNMLEPGISWTFGLAAQLAWHGATHPWQHAAVAACRAAIATYRSNEVHALAYAARFACDVLDGGERTRALAAIRDGLDGAALFVAVPPVTTYGLTPLHFVPRSDSPMRVFFDTRSIERHLDDLLDSQMDDGGWPIRFQPPSEAAVLEWRGRCTLDALATLGAWGRLQA